MNDYYKFFLFCFGEGVKGTESRQGIVDVSAVSTFVVSYYFIVFFFS